MLIEYKDKERRGSVLASDVVRIELWGNDLLVELTDRYLHLNYDTYEEKVQAYQKLVNAWDNYKRK